MEKIFENCQKDIECRKCPNRGRCILKRCKINQKVRKKKIRIRIFSLTIMISMFLGVFMVSSANYIDENQRHDTEHVEQNVILGKPVVFPIRESILERISIPEETEKKPSYEGPRDYYVYELSEEDKIYIAKVVYREARGECLEGSVAVAATILNRYVSDSELFNSESIHSLVTQKNQFADISKVTKKMLEEYPNCLQSVELACKGWDPTRACFEDGAKYFYAPNSKMSEYQKKLRKNIIKYTIGNHNFHNEFNGE